MSLSASVCSRLQHQHETIYELIRGFSEEQLRQRLQPDKWSAFEQLAIWFLTNPFSCNGCKKYIKKKNRRSTGM